MSIIVMVHSKLSPIERTFNQTANTKIKTSFLLETKMKLGLISLKFVKGVYISSKFGGGDMIKL